MTLSDLALHGPVAASDREYCRLAPAVDTLAVLDACEVIPVTETAGKNLDACQPWQA